MATSPTVIRATLATGQQYLGNKTASYYTDLLAGCGICRGCHDDIITCLDMVTSALDKRINVLNLFDDVTETLYNQLVALNGSFVPTPVTIQAVINFTQPNNMTVGDADQTLVATSNSPAPITYASSDTSKATIINAGSGIYKLHVVAAGSVTITASQGATAGYTAAADVPKTVVMSTAPVQATVYWGYYDEVPEGGLSDLTYQFSQPYNLGVNSITLNYTAAAIGKRIAAKFPINQPDFTHYFNTTLNQGDIPDYIMQKGIISGNDVYYSTAVFNIDNSNQNIILTL